MEHSLSKKVYIATFLGNLVEHYDKVLFGLIAPFLAPLFFPNSDPITALILIYLPLGFIARPLGALYWGKMGDRHGRKRVLYFSILGMSLTLVMTGFLPTHKTVGLLAAILLHFKRGLACFFAAGEGTGASLLLIENSKNSSRDMMSSLYEVSSMIGVFLASLVITILTFQNKVIAYWRPLFILSGLFGFVCFWFRKDVFKEPKTEFKRIQIQSLFSIIKENAVPFSAILFVTGFLCANYRIATKLMNGYLPVVSKITAKEMMLTHTFLILYDAFMLPIFGFISKKVGKEKLIYISLFLLTFSVAFFYFLLSKPTLSKVCFLRMYMITLGIAISAPFGYWSMSLISADKRFRLLSLARAFGAQWIGGPAISFSLILYKWTGWVFSPAIYLFFIGSVSIIFLSALHIKREKTQKA